MHESNPQLMIASFLQQGALMGYRDILCWIEPCEQWQASKEALERSFEAAQVEFIDDAVWSKYVESVPKSRLRDAGVSNGWAMLHDFPAGDPELIAKMEVARKMVQSRAEVFWGAAPPWRRAMVVAPWISAASVNPLLAKLEAQRISKSAKVALGASGVFRI